MTGIQLYHIMEVHLFSQFAKNVFFFSIIAIEYYKILFLYQLRQSHAFSSLIYYLSRLLSEAKSTAMLNG